MSAEPELPASKSNVTVQTHHTLRTITEEEFRQKADAVLRDAADGIQTAVLGPDGKTVRSIIGINGTRFFQDPDPDPLDELDKPDDAGSPEKRTDAG